MMMLNVLGKFGFQKDLKSKSLFLLEMFNLMRKLLYVSTEGQRWYLCQCVIMVFPVHTYLLFGLCLFRRCGSNWFAINKVKYIFLRKKHWTKVTQI